MTKILYWNVENFSINKIQNPRARKRQKGSSKNEQDASVDRMTYIMDHFQDVNPDIFVIVEVETPYNANRGVLSGGGGKSGLLAVWEYLEENVHNSDWCLVPPLITGNKESVGVFYRSTRVTFTGPNYWAGGNGPTTPAITALTAQDYPDDWQDCLPANNQCAARVQFLQTQQQPVPHPAPPRVNVDFGVGVRHPYQTTFTDGTGRTINIFSVHAPANFRDATQFLQDMASMEAVASTVPANELRLVLGDFNLSLLRIADSTYTDCYAPLTGLHVTPYTVALAPGGAPPNPLNGYAGYFATHMRPRANARCWSQANSTAYYPAYFYTGDANGAANASIDNVLYAAGAGALPAAPELTIINGVVGSPFDNAGANPGGAPEGTFVFPKQVNWDWAGLNPQWVAPNWEAPDVAPLYTQKKGVRKWFLGWEVYAKLRSTSDHIALLFEG